MTRPHPQTANAPEAKIMTAKTREPLPVRVVKTAEEMADLYGWPVESCRAFFEPVKLWAALAPVEGRYRALPGEPITLTDAQIEEWRRGQRTPEECYEIARQIGRKMDASARLHQRQFFARYDEILKHCFVTPLRAKR